MPAYEYELLHPDTGAILARITLAVPVAERDAITLRRREIPNSVAIAGAARDPGQPANQVLDTYKRIETRLGNNREFRRRIGHSPEAIKRAWSE
jgi:hypothetical protein